ncbi:hypothetical protein AMTR_s00039p00024100 [Amborella trichopoda]|uniref:Uncharacterized protein n=1 Tax=Amborella trichopoda TaxID=13333 RepID=U5CZW9_AMBTC|nr:hypothetical protein AMTR_s00039p00024100 [Amborella trichopoda]
MNALFFFPSIFQFLQQNKVIVLSLSYSSRAQAYRLLNTVSTLRQSYLDVTESYLDMTEGKSFANHPSHQILGSDLKEQRLLKVWLLKMEACWEYLGFVFRLRRATTSFVAEVKWRGTVDCEKDLYKLNGEREGGFSLIEVDSTEFKALPWWEGGISPTT